MVKPIYIDTPIQGKDIKLTVSGSRGAEIQRALETRSKMLGKVKGYEYSGPNNFRTNSTRFTPPVYDLAEIARAADIEPYISQSVRKHREQILKEGYTISGTDDIMVDYVKQRLFEIALVSGITTEQWLRELATNLVTYHNGYLVFRRDAKRSSGKPITLYGKVVNPIAGIFIGDPVSMEVKVDKYGTPRKWRQSIQGVEDSDVTAETQYNTEDVVHVHVDRKTGYTYGTPFLLAVLDDIRALRKLEEVAIIVASKEAFPLYHYKVGTENRPAIYYEGGEDEVSTVHGQVAGLPAQGYIVTSERHEIKLVSREGAALDLSPYLDYFEARVVAGLRLSPLDLGRGNSMSRGTATNVNKGLQDSAKDYQQVMSDCLTFYVVLPLLLEGGFDVTEENLVRFTFPTIDREEERAMQNHGLQLHMGNAISGEEFRKHYLNRQPMTAQQEADTPFAKQSAADKELANIGAAARASRASSDKLSKAVTSQISNKGQPKNQYGTKPAKSRFKANDYQEEVVGLFKGLRNNVIASMTSDSLASKDLDQLFSDFISSAVEHSIEVVNEQIDEGYSKAKKQYLSRYPDEDIDFEEVGNRARTRFFDNFITKSYWKQLGLFKDQIQSLLKPDIDNNIDSSRIINCLNLCENLISILIRDQLITSERFGFIKFAKKVGCKTIDLINPDNQESVELDIDKLIYKTFIPTNDNLTHYLSFSESK